MKLVNRCFICFLVLLSPFVVNAQSYNSEKVTMSNYLIRMFEQEHFEGVKIVDGYYKQYLISVVVFPSSEEDCTMDRIAEIEARSQANRFFNGSRITEYDLIIMSDKTDENKMKKVIKVVNEKSIGFVKALELLSKTEIDNQMVYFYSTEIKK